MMRTVTARAFLVISIVCAGAMAAGGADQDPKTVKVFILSGQSNMVGWSHVRTLPSMGKDPKHRELFKKLSRGKDRWVERDDVFIDSIVDDKARKGKLSVGYGGGGEDWLGPELAFGVEMGDLHDEPVLLIKAAWGGKDLYCDFRPPSAGDPDYEIPKSGDKDREVGAFYRRLVEEVHRALADMGENFPALKRRTPELAGFVWFQGWNEMFAAKEIQEQVYAEYPSNFANLVADLRREFDAPELPVVLGEMGVDGEQPSQKVQKLRAAQEAITKQESLRGSVSLAPTSHLWDEDVHKAFRTMEDVRGELSRKLSKKIEKGMKSKLKGKSEEERKKLIRNETNRAVEKTREYQKAKEAFDAVGSHWLCHYHGSAKMYCTMGQSLAKGLVRVIQQDEK